MPVSISFISLWIERKLMVCLNKKYSLFPPQSTWCFVVVVLLFPPHKSPVILSMYLMEPIYLNQLRKEKLLEFPFISVFLIPNTNRLTSFFIAAWHLNNTRPWRENKQDSWFFGSDKSAFKTFKIGRWKEHFFLNGDVWCI